MQNIRQKYYPTIIQAVHLIILYIFIQTLVDFPLAMIDYYQDTNYLYNPVKKIIVHAGSTLFILIYGFRKSRAPLKKVFPLRSFNPLILLPLITLFWGAHNLIEIVNIAIDKVIPAPPWFWELFNNIFRSDYGFWGAFLKVAVMAPVIEELIFRGIILQGFRRNYSDFTAIFISAILFSLFHLNPWQMPATFVLGLILGWLMIRFQNILLSILGHSINNLLVLLIVTYWQEINTHAIFLMEKKEELELSVLVVAFSLALMMLISMWNRKKNKR